MTGPRDRGHVVLAAATTVVLSGSCSFGMPRGATEQGEATFALWQQYMVAGVVVAAIVYGLIGWSVIRYRRRRGEDPEALGRQFREHRGLEIFYTAVPVLIVVVLFALAVRTGNEVDDVADDPDLQVHVEAFAWGWRFAYPDHDVVVLSESSGEGVTGPEMVLPLGATVRIVLTSNDVIHSFWVPGFLYKHDAIPGRTFEFDLTPTEVGTFSGECAEFCGLNHAFMTFSVRVVQPDEFDTWVDQHASEVTT
jgi:cytochrome c oxidase subunit 2